MSEPDPPPVKLTVTRVPSLLVPPPPRLVSPAEAAAEDELERRVLGGEEGDE